MLNRIRSGYHIEELETELGLQQKEVTCPLQSSKSSLHQMNLCVYIDIYIYISVYIVVPVLILQVCMVRGMAVKVINYQS